MAISVASHNHTTWSGQSGGTNESITGLTCSAGDVIYVLIINGTAPTLTGETFTSKGAVGSATLYRCAVTANHSSASIGTTVNTGFAPGCALFVAFTGVDNTQDTIGSVNSSSGSSASASVTTAKANSVVCLFESSNVDASSAGTGYTLDEHIINTTAVAAEHASAVTSGSGTNVTPTMTLASAASWSAVAVSLAPSGGTTPLARKPLVASADYRSFWFDA